VTSMATARLFPVFDMLPTLLELLYHDLTQPWSGRASLQGTINFGGKVALNFIP
jgi:hypothetical protein